MKHACKEEKCCGGHKDSSKYERIIAAWTRTVGIWTIVLALAIIYTARVLTKTDDSVRDTLRLGQRAYVHLERIDVSAVDYWIHGTETQGPITIHDAPQNQGKMLRSEFLITNAGNTPARSVRIRINCGFAEGLPDPYDILQRGETKEISRSVGARQTTAFSVDVCDFKSADPLFNARMRADPVFFAGDIRYEDGVEPGVIHRTRFGHQLVVRDFGKGDRFTSMNVTTEPAGENNCFDEDCKD